MKNKNRKSLFALALVSGATLAGCGTTAAAATHNSPAHSNGKTIVTFWESHSAANQQGQALAQVVSKFNQSHPGIKVEVHVTPASAKALAAVQAGDPPVMAMIGHQPQYGYEQANALVNLKPFINGPNGFPSQQLHQIWPAVWQAEFTPSHQQYLFPVDIKVAEFFYNATLWKKAGLSTPPTTWSQLMADAQQIQSKTGAIGLGARLDHNDWLPLFYSNGGHYYKPGHPGQLDLNSPAMAQTIRQVTARDNAPYTKILSYNTSFEDFASGKLGILENTADGYEMVREQVGGKFPVGVFSPPPGSTGHSDYLYQGLSFVIFKHASTAQQQAAWSFIKYFDSPQGQAIWSTVGGEPPMSQADVASVEKMAGSQFSANPGPYAGTAVAIRELESGHVIHKIIGPNQSEIDTVIQNQIQSVVQHKETVSQALSNMQKQATAYLSGAAVQ